MDLHPCSNLKERCLGSGRGETQRVRTVSGTNSSVRFLHDNCTGVVNDSTAVESHLGGDDALSFMETERTAHTFIAQGPF